MDLDKLRIAVIGLIAFAGAEDGALLAATSSGRDEGGPQKWAARPLVSHNAEFRRQQVLRFVAIRHGQTPPKFPEIDHRSDAVYRRYCEQSRTADENSRQATLALIDEVRLASDEDLVDPSRTLLARRQAIVAADDRQGILASDRTSQRVLPRSRRHRRRRCSSKTRRRVRHVRLRTGSGVWHGLLQPGMRASSRRHADRSARHAANCR